MRLVEDVVQAREVVLSAGGDSNRLVCAGRNNEVGIGRDGELAGGVVFLLERVLELESLSNPDLHFHFVVVTDGEKVMHSTGPLCPTKV